MFGIPKFVQDRTKAFKTEEPRILGGTHRTGVPLTAPQPQSLEERVTPTPPAPIPAKVKQAQLVIAYIRSKNIASTQEVLATGFFDDLLAGKTGEDASILEGLIADLKARVSG